MNTKRQVASAVAVTVLAFLPATLRAQDAVYTVPGISAWTTAKTYGFLFHPEAASGESVSRPLDGVTTLLTRSVKTLLTTQKVTVAQVIGGQPSVNQGERNTTFNMFGGRTLAPGWIVKSVDLGGSFTFVEQPRLGTNDLSFRVRLVPGGGATLKNVVLHGPAGRDWKEAFSAPLTKEYVVNGVVAWNAARKYGFTFKPLTDGLEPSRTGVRLVNPADGVLTVLVANPGFVFCDPKYDGDCILGQIAGGNMSVPSPMSGQSQSVNFLMFGDKLLSPRWTIKSVTLSNGVWVKPVLTNTDNPRFVVKLSSIRGTGAATGIVKTITLVGPSNAASFEDAFKGARNPAQ